MARPRKIYLAEGFSWVIKNDTYCFIKEVDFKSSVFYAKTIKPRRIALIEHVNCGNKFESGYHHAYNKQRLKCPFCNPRIDIKIGSKINRWAIIEGPFGSCSRQNKRWWLCECECGTVKKVNEHNLRNNLSQSCGCLQKEIAHEISFKDLTGKQFGRWTVIKQHGRDNHNKITWLCKCECGNEGIVNSQCLVSGHSQSCGCYNRDVSRFARGEDHPNWNGGNSTEIDKIRHSLKYKGWVLACFQRDSFQCQYSGLCCSSTLSVHHIKPFAQILAENNITTLDEARDCKELWNVNNGITLARKWHLQGSEYEANSFHNIYGVKDCNSSEFEEWFLKRPYQEGKNYYQSGDIVS